MQSRLNRREIRTILLIGQAIALLIGVWVAYLALVYRPYIYCGQFLCSFTPEYYRVVPPTPNDGDTITFDVPLYIFQLILIPWVTAIAVLLLRKDITRTAILTQFGIAAVGLNFLVAATIASVVIASWANIWTSRLVFQFVVIAAVTSYVIWLLRRETAPKSVLTRFAIAVTGLLLLQGANIVIEPIGAMYFGGFWAFLSGLLLSSICVVRMAMIRSEPHTLPISERAWNVRESVQNFIDELLLRK